MAGNCARYSILIVDDKELDRNGVCYLIQQYGLDLHPIPAASGSEALEILRRMPVHILLTDVKMPEMTGHELIVEAKKIQPDLKVIIFSSYENFDYAHKAMDLGVTKYLLKPIKVDKFLSCIKSMIHVLREGERTRIISMYFNVMTGLCNPDGSGLSGDEKAGDVLLLDFVEPFFNLHHLSLRGEDDEETRFIDIPLNEYQCAFIAPTEEEARDCLRRLEQILAERGGQPVHPDLRRPFRNDRPAQRAVQPDGEPQLLQILSGAQHHSGHDPSEGGGGQHRRAALSGKSGGNRKAGDPQGAAARRKGNRGRFQRFAKTNIRAHLPGQIHQQRVGAGRTERNPSRL